MLTTLPIPESRDIHDWKEVPIVESGEPLVNLKKYGFHVRPMYHELGYANSLDHCLARLGVAELLLRAQALLPDGYRFQIWDAYRPHAVQKALFDTQLHQLSLVYPDASNSWLLNETQKFVSMPSTDPLRPAPHSTGAAIDLTLIAHGQELDLGTPFDDFSDIARPNYFERNTGEDSRNLMVRHNRRILFHAMSAVGFKCFPSEYWHYSVSDQMAALDAKTVAIYGGV
jgi:zinc D-Ala-D-Ala dipeptidase